MESLVEKRFDVPNGTDLKGEEALAYLEEKVRLVSALGDEWKIGIAPRTLKMWIATGRDYLALYEAQSFRVPFTKQRINKPSRYVFFWLGWLALSVAQMMFR